METRHPVDGLLFGSEFPAICNHCGVMTAWTWSRKTLKIFEEFLRFFEKRPLTAQISKFCFESLHGDTDRRCCVQISSNLAEGKSAKSCVAHIYLTKKFSAAFQTVATARITPKICQGQPQQCTYSAPYCIQIGLATFGGVTAERVNTVFAP